MIPSKGRPNVVIPGGSAAAVEINDVGQAVNFAPLRSIRETKWQNA